MAKKVTTLHLSFVNDGERSHIWFMKGDEQVRWNIGTMNPIYLASVAKAILDYLAWRVKHDPT